MKKFLLLLVFLISFVSPSFSGIPQFAPLEKFEAVDHVVYITNTGTKYHKGSCHHLRKSKIKTTKSKAINSGYSACKACY